MKIAIVGAGAVGSYYGARLANAGHEVHFLLRSDYEHVSKKGICIQSIHGDFELKSVLCAKRSSEIGEADLVIVAWKTTANGYAEGVISPLVGTETKLLTLQNGLGNAELLGDLFGREKVLGGLCFVCINRLDAGLISHTASGLIRLAWLSGGVDSYLENLVNLLKKAEIRCEAVDNLEKALWMKLVWNFPFNGLAIAEGGVDTHVLLHELNLEPLVRELMHEVITVGRALGHDISYDMIDQQVAITLPMGAYKPSSMIDFVAGKPVEYESIWQKPLEVAESIGVEVPQMRHLAARIRQKLDL